MISSSAASFLGFVFETLFFGIFLVVFCISAHMQWTRHKQEPLAFGNKLVFVFSIFLCLFITSHWWLNLWGIYVAFLQTPNEAARELYIANAATKLSLARLTIYEIQTWMGDFLLVYRLYHVAGRRWLVVIPPIVTACCLIICSGHALYYTSKIDFTQPQTLPEIVSLQYKWSLSTFVVTISENIYCLALVTFFIWRTHRGVHRATSSNLQSVLLIFIESAGMWVICILITFIVFLTNQTACYIPLYVTNAVLGIAFCMMTIRLQLRDKGTTIGSGSSKPSYFNNFKAGSGEQLKENSHSTGSTNTQNEPMVFSSKQTIDNSTFDSAFSKV